MRILILGKDGMVGRSLLSLLSDPRQPGPHTGDMDRMSSLVLAGAFGSETDIADKTALARILAETKPDVVVNAAAYNQVDLAERERDKAQATNAVGPRNLTELAEAYGFRLVHYSTNFVFDGTAGRPYKESDPVSPLSHYGATKAEGDRYVLEADPGHLVIRTAWIFHEQGKNFLRWAYDHRHDPELRIVSDQTGNPTYAWDVAAFTLWAITHDVFGLVNFTNAGVCTKHEMVCALMRVSGGTAHVLEAKSSDFDSLADRPAQAALDLTLVRDRFGYPVPKWQDAVERFVEACGKMARRLDVGGQKR